VVRGRAPRHRGVYVGEVIKVLQHAVQVKTTIDLKPGDGLVFDAASWRSPDEKEEGGSIYSVKHLKGEVLLEFANHQIDFSRIRKGDLVWRTHDPQLAKIYKPITDATEAVYTRPLSFSVKARASEELVVTATSENKSVTVRGNIKLEPAQKRALDKHYLHEHLGKLGGTPFHLENVSLDAKDSLFVPVSEINALRREAVERLLALRIVQDKTASKLVMQQTLEHLESHVQSISTHHTRLHVLVRTPEQLEAALEMNPESITLDYLELYGLKPSVEKIKAVGIRCRVASPRILKPTEQNVLKFLLSLECEILVRSTGLLYDLQHAKGVMYSGDFSLNCANAISAHMYLDMGVSSITPTHDLNAQQIADLTKYVLPEKLEVIAYQHLPVFHTEHCVFCRFLSAGTDYTNCGHPCESHRIALKDKQGREHPVMADVGCRNTVFGAEAQTAAKHLEMWLKAGLRDFRLEFVHETALQVKEVIKAFQQAFAGQKSFGWLEQQLKHLSPTGITEGSLFVPEDFSHLPPLL
jgi:U32 family peptidase